MKSLYLKVLVWSIATVAVAMMGLFLHSRFAPRRGFWPPSQSTRILADVARRIYREEGAAGLKTFLAQASEDSGTHFYVTDAAGKDLITGEDRSAQFHFDSARPPGFFSPFPNQARPAIVAPSSDNSVRWITVLNVDPTPRSSPSDAFIWILAAVSLLAYLFTFYLVSPLRKLSSVVERFGSGELTARARSTRRDELGNLARAFDQMAERIDTLVTTERRLLQDISHELRTPLARMRFAVEVARSDPNQKESLDRIRKECDRLALLTDELLEISVADGDPAARHLERADLSELLAEVVADASIEASNRGVRLSLRTPAELYVRMDRELLRRAIDNVVRNAIRYSPDAEPIEVELATAGREARVSIRDRGPGVPDGMLEMIFQPFFRAESHRARVAESGGVGLGLAIATRAVQWHHGTIRAENAEPGLRVSIFLPGAA